MISGLNGPCFALIMASSMAGWSLPLCTLSGMTLNVVNARMTYKLTKQCVTPASAVKRVSKAVWTLAILYLHRASKKPSAAELKPTSSPFTPSS